MRADAGFVMLLVLVLAIAAANVYLVLTAGLPPHLGGMTVVAGLVAIGLGLLQARR